MSHAIGPCDGKHSISPNVGAPSMRISSTGAPNWDAINTTFTVISECRAASGRRRPLTTGLSWPPSFSLSTTTRFNAGFSRRWRGDSAMRSKPPNSGETGLARLEAADRPPVDLVILDLVMPDLDGMGVLTRMRQRAIAIPAIVQTAHGSIEAVISAMRAGALRFRGQAGRRRASAGVDQERACASTRWKTNCGAPRAARTGELSFRDIVTKVESMARTIRLAERAAKSNIPVLIEGESGVGKELMARAIQGGSERRGKPFVTVNCGALPENLVESILFGHEKGAFTGATEKHAGKFAEAHGGTLFLDEIGELPLGGPGQIAARAAGRRNRPRRRAPPGQGRHPPRLGDEPEPHRTRQARPLSRGSVLSPERLPDHHPAASRPRDGRARSGAPLPRALLRRRRQAHPRHRQRRFRAALRLRLAGQCAPARKRDVSRGGAGGRRRTDDRRISADRRAGRRLRRAHSRRPAARRRDAGARLGRRGGRISNRAIPMSCA